MKRILNISALICVAVALFLTYTVSAADWDTSATDGVAAAVEKNNELTLSYDSGSGARSASAEKKFDFSENSQINLAFSAEVSGLDSSVNRRIYMRKNSTTQIELINFSNDSIYMLGNKDTKIPDVTLEEGKTYNVIACINAADGSISVFLDGNKVFSDNIDSAKWNKLDLSNFRIYIRNNTTSKTETCASKFIIRNFEASDTVTGFGTVPEDGSTSVDAAAVDAIKVDFDGIVSPSVFNAENFQLTENEIEIPFTVKGIGKTAYVKPDTAFSENKTYKLKVKNVCDLLGNVVIPEKTIMFITVGDDYKKPVINLTCDKSDFVTTESARLNISAESEIGIEKIELYVDGVLKETFSGSTTYDLKCDAGNHDVYAVVYDTNNYSAVSDTIKLNFSENLAPVVKISGVTNGESIEKSSLDKIKIDVSDEDGEVLRTEIYNGTELIASLDKTPVSYDFSGLPYGRHLIVVKVYDDKGAMSQASVSFTVTVSASQTVRISTDYSDYKSAGNTFPKGLSKGLFDQNTTALKSSNEYGEEHGTVVEYTVFGNPDANTWSYLETSYTASGYQLDMDVYLLSDMGQIYTYFKTNNIVLDPFTIERGKINVKGYSKEKATADFTAGEWHHLTVITDIIGLKYSVFVDGKAVAENFTLTPGLGAIDMRIGISANGTKDKVGFAFDNLRIVYNEPAPQITAVGYDDADDCTEVSPAAKVLRFKTNVGLNAVTVKKENINLYKGNIKVPFESAVWSDDDNEVQITVSEPLQSNTNYKLEITDEVMDSSNTPLPGSIYAYFNTSFKDVDVVSCTINKSNGKIAPVVKVKNSTNASKSIFSIVNIMSDKQTTEMLVKEIKISPSTESEVSLGSFNVGDSQTAEIYFWDDLIRQNAITDVLK